MTITEILQKARERARQLGLPYSGALTPAEAHELWRNAPGAKLVDVRTRAEWDYVGRIPGAVEIEILAYPGNRPNAAFVTELESKVDKAAPVLFICRSGGRSTMPRCWPSKPGTARPITCSKASRATGTRKAIAIPRAGGGRQGCPGRKAKTP